MTRAERIQTYFDVMPKELHIFFPELNTLGFFDAPAALKHHGNHEGGLFDHSYTVMSELLNLTDRLELKWSRSLSPYIVGMYHDLCKCDDYAADDDGNGYHYNNDTWLNGHGEKSVIITQSLLAGAGMTLNADELACIRWHMGAYEKDTKLWDYYGKAVETYPVVLYTHTADMIASHIKGV